MATKFFTTYKHSAKERAMWEVCTKLSDRAKNTLEEYLRNFGVNWWSKFLVNYTNTKNSLTQAICELDSYKNAPVEYEAMWCKRPMVELCGFSLSDHIKDLQKNIDDYNYHCSIFAEIAAEMDKLNPLLIFTVDVH